MTEETSASDADKALRTSDVLARVEQLVARERERLRGLDISSYLATEQHLQDLQELADSFGYRLVAQSVGMVKQVGDGVALVSGLHGVMANELVIFADGTYGLAMDLHEHYVGCILLGPGENIQAGDVVYETGRVVDVPVGEALLGRVVNALGQPIDDLGPLEAEDRRPIEQAAPEFINRSPVDQPLQTGIKAIDSIIPLGRGQRELIIWDRQTGKSAIAIDTVLNQRGQDVRCVYVCVGQKMSTVAQIVEVFREHRALEYVTVVVASAEASPSMSYLAPYAGCAIAEAFMYAGQGRLDRLRRSIETRHRLSAALLAAPAAGRSRSVSRRHLLSAFPFTGTLGAAGSRAGRRKHDRAAHRRDAGR